MKSCNRTVKRKSFRSVRMFWKSSWRCVKTRTPIEIGRGCSRKNVRYLKTNLSFRIKYVLVIAKTWAPEKGNVLSFSVLHNWIMFLKLVFISFSIINWFIIGPEWTSKIGTQTTYLRIFRLKLKDYEVRVYWCTDSKIPFWVLRDNIFIRIFIKKTKHKEVTYYKIYITSISR